MNETLYHIGIDIGGTKVNIGIVLPDGTIVDNTVLPSSGAANTSLFTDRICIALEALLAANSIPMSQVAHIGVGIPGTADASRGLVEYSCNLFGTSVPLGDFFRARLCRDVTVVQDSWAAAYAEHCFGAGQKRNNMICVTVGTGIGCGVLLNGRIFGGAMHTAGELGHTPIVWQGRPCSCGRLGCLEAYAGGKAIFGQAMERFPEKMRGLPEKTESVFDLALKGDADALALIDECVDKLAYGIAMGMNLLAVDTVVISGGISVHHALVIAPLKERILSYGYPAWASTRTITVKAAELGVNAPMVGAAFLTLDKMTLEAN